MIALWSFKENRQQLRNCVYTPTEQLLEQYDAFVLEFKETSSQVYFFRMGKFEVGELKKPKTIVMWALGFSDKEWIVCTKTSCRLRDQASG